MIGERFSLVQIAIIAILAIGSVVSIYDPRATTKKPPLRREQVLPWYLDGHSSKPPGSYFEIEERSRKPKIVESGTWTAWRKNEGSDLEQRTEVDSSGFDQQSTQFDQYDDRYSPEQVKTSSGTKNYPAYHDNEFQTSSSKFPSGGSKGDRLHVQIETDDGIYEGISSDSKKPRKEKLSASNKPSSKIARFDHRLGVQCPDPGVTGQFVYPPDCKFFVNCWKGRAFVQPCSPGTLFNPDTLECDFPHKVNCYGGELADFTNADFSDSAGRHEPLISGSQHQPMGGKIQEARCPPHITGLMAHPSDCTKFLQCANGGTIVMDCGLGTVFNPSVSVCDWPRNVRGCEDAIKSDEESISPLSPPNPHAYESSKTGYGSKSEYNAPAPRKVSCPPDFSGLLPHPDTCKKFLQCANGITYIMDCGPGTAFNPVTTVCDWPYNVPGCSEEKETVNTHNSWAPGGGSWQSSKGEYSMTTPSPRPTWIPSLSPTRRPTPAPIPTWRPTRKPNSGSIYDTQYPNRPSYPEGQHYQSTNSEVQLHQTSHSGVQPHPYYEESTPYNSYNPASNQNNPYRGNAEENRHWNNHNPYHHQHYPHHQHHHLGTQNVGDNQFTTDSSSYPHHYGTHNMDNSQFTTDSSSYPHNSYNHVKFPDSDSAATSNGPHYHQISHGSTYPDSDSAATSNGPMYNHDHHHPHHNHDVNEFESWGHPNHHSFDRESSKQESSLPFGQSRPSQHLEPPPIPDPNNRENYGRTGPRFPYSNFNQPGSPTDGVSSSPWNREQNRTSSHHPTYNHTSWSPSRVPGDSAIFKPSSWRPPNSSQDHREEQDDNLDPDLHEIFKCDCVVFKNLHDNYVHSCMNCMKFHCKFCSYDYFHEKYENLCQRRCPDENNSSIPKEAGGFNSEDKLHNWEAASSIYEQSTVDRESEAKLNQWEQKTNLFQPTKGQAKPGVKNSTPGIKTSNYPNGIYVNSNGTRGHLITTDIEINQGHSQTRTQKPIQTTVSYESVYERLQPPYYSPPVNRGNVARNFSGYPYALPHRGTPNRFNPIIEGSVNVLTTTQKPEVITKKESHIQRIGKTIRTTTEDPNIPTVSIEYEENYKEIDQAKSSDPLIENNKTRILNIIEPTLDAFEVDLLDEKRNWKPTLVFENKTKPKEQHSVIMKINKKNTDVELINIEAAPLVEEETVFPVYYIPPVHPLSGNHKPRLLTPISGQVVRLRGGSDPREGYVEVQGAQPGWGAVCDSRNGWSLKEAHVVCRQLGYSRGAEMAWQGRDNRKDAPSWIAANTVSCLGNETKFQSCKFTHEQECKLERDAVGVKCIANRLAHCSKDEIPHEGQCYHLADPSTSLTHAEALDYCTQRGSRLLHVTEQAENNFISDWLIRSHPEISTVMTSGVGFTTFNRTLWLWEDASHAKFKFAKWWPGWMDEKKHAPWAGSRPLCILLKREYPCYDHPESQCMADYFFWDVEDCTSTMKGHSYICKRPYEYIGCVYGKGIEYNGKANVTISGKDCLPWNDDRVAHSLMIQVPNRDARDKLKGHNYCRNPNPQKESTPWCFTGSYGAREYCDIPFCGKMGTQRLPTGNKCKPNHFQCQPDECVPSSWVCDGQEDCTNGADEKKCVDYLSMFKKLSKQRLEGYDVEKWLNTPLKTCALRCKEADFTCRSFAHNATGNVCLLSDGNIGMTGALKPHREFDYYEMKDRSVNCEGMFVCGNGKCVNQTQVCDGKNDCRDRSDENVCTAANLDYGIRLVGGDGDNEGRIEVKVFGHWGQVCDDGFGMINADVICRELGYSLGALEVRPGGFYGNMNPPTSFMVDQLRCRGNETSLRECDFEGWGVHDCQPEEAVGVVCKTGVDSCQEGHWKCDNSPVCILPTFICDVVVDCPDGSDESSAHCEAPFEIRLANGSSRMEGRVEVRHHGVWGTVCDDDFSNAAATVICRSLGYGGPAQAKKNGYFGPGEGPIWLDEVFCHGNESQLFKCEHDHWGQHNCNHEEDAGVICSPGDVNSPQSSWNSSPEIHELSINDILPTECGSRSIDYPDEDDFIFAKVVRGTVAPKGSYPWQASIRVRGHSRSSHWCGAVVLSPLHVLTAAHCLEGYNKGTYFVRAGDYNTEIEEGTEVEANIEDYYIHEEFRKGHRMNNDIALVLLKGRGIPLGRDVMPICLPPEDAEYPAGLNCTISGFGSVETGKSTQSRDLRYGWIPLLDQSVCRAGYVYGEGAISEGMVCAGHLDEGVDTCDGDSGGPLACYTNEAFTLYGITSWGQHCGRANKPGVYVRVAHYRSWIDEKIKQSLSGR